MFVVCDICQCNISSAEMYDRHINGKRHKSQLEYYLRKKENAERSVFVRGFPSCTQEQELMGYFSMFGMVGKVVYDEKECQRKKIPPFCIIEFLSPHSAKAVLDYGHHVLNSQKLEVRPRSFKELSTEPYFPWQRQENNPEQPWLQNNFQPMQQMMAQKNVYVPDPNQYNMQGPYGMRAPYNMQRGQGQQQGHGQGQGQQQGHGQGQGQQQGQGQGKRKKPKGPQPIGRAKDSEGQDFLPIQVAEFEGYLTQNQCIGIQTQMMLLVELTQVPAVEFQHRYTICKVLEDALSPFFPGMTVNQFGSSVNGFGIKGCDMDVFVDLSKLGIPCRTGNLNLPFTRDLHSLKKSKTKGPLSQAEVNGMKNLDKLKLINRILLEHAPSCSDSTIIPSQRCPIIRFTHSQSNIKCDLSINNKLALQNTRLLQTFSLFDARIKPLVYTIRYWGKVKEIAGNPQATPRLSNYALTLLVMYYLMNTNPPVLLPVEDLARMCGTDRTIIDQWDCSFVSAQFMPPTQNIQTAEELLFGFFEYYSHFDFMGNAMAVRTGKPLQTTRAQLEKTMKVGVMNLQDPFVLDHNITQNVNEKMLIKIIKELRIAEAKAAKWFDVAHAETKSLIEILNEDIPEGIDLRKTTLTPAASAMGMPLGDYQFLVELNTTKLSRPDLLALEGTGNLQLTWSKKMIVFLYRIIERVLMFDCDIAGHSLPVVMKPSRNYTIYRRVKPPQRLKDPEPPTKKQKTDDYQTAPVEDEGEGGATEEFSVTKEGYIQKSWANKGENTEQGENPENAETESSVDKKVEEKDDDGMVVVEDVQEEEESGDNQQKKEEDNADNPSLFPYDFSESELYLDMDVKVMCRVWAERKNLGRELRDRGFTESVQLEQTITERLFYDVIGPSRHPIVKFRCVLKSIIYNNTASIMIDCMPNPNQKEFNCIYHYMKKFAQKMVDKFFYQ